MAKYIIDESTLKNLANAIRKVNGESEPYTPTEMIEAVTNIMDSATYILVDENGNEYPAVYVDSETVFTATANDIREGCIAATGEGVIEGTKYIPPYITVKGYKVIPAGSELSVTLNVRDAYDYTAFQALVCLYNTSMANSVATDKVVIEDNVYLPSSTESISTIVKDANTKTVRFGVKNETDKPCIIRFFTYKED